MATRADELSGSNLYKSILRDLMRFSNVQSVLPTEGRMNAVLVYYEKIKHLYWCKTNANFWLQYGIANLALKRFVDARIKLETAYAHAKALSGYDTFMIDNSAARLELEEAIDTPKRDREEAMLAFRKARAILIAQVSKKEHRHYPFRVASKYSPFLATHRHILQATDVDEIARAARFVRRRIDGLSAYRASHRYVAECRRAMQEILDENPILDN
jgi:hypothetical protein